MTRRPLPRHRPSHHTRRRRTIDALLVTAATLALTAVMAAGNAIAPRPRIDTAPDPPVAVTDRGDGRASRYERETTATTATSTARATEDAIPTRACRCAPRQEPLTTRQASAAASPQVTHEEQPMTTTTSSGTTARLTTTAPTTTQTTTETLSETSESTTTATTTETTTPPASESAIPTTTDPTATTTETGSE